MKQQSGLGKGLSALISENFDEIGNGAYIPALSIEKISPNPYQPRMHIDDAKLQELANSIKANGVVEPLIVTKKDNNNYEIIAGERRWRACLLAGIGTVPVVVKEASPQQMLELAIIENIQRADLNPIEEANAFKELVEKFNVTHYEISDKIGISRSAVANKIRLLQLPEEVRRGVLEEKISEGHARALLGLEEPGILIAAYRKIVLQGLTVRATEELVRRLNMNIKKRPHRVDARILDERTSRIEYGLKVKFHNQNVRLSRSIRGGKIEIPFKNDEELNKLVGILNIEL